MGPSGGVIAAEPLLRMQHVLRNSFELNGARNIEVFETAISDRCGTAALHLSPDTNTGSTGLQQSTDDKNPEAEVETITLGDLLVAISSTCVSSTLS